MMRLNPIKLLTRSQSQMLRRSSPNKDEEKNLISFITKKRDNLISAKESTLTPTISRRKVKIILPKINNSMVNNQPILIVAKRYLSRMKMVKLKAGTSASRVLPAPVKTASAGTIAQGSSSVLSLYSSSLLRTIRRRCWPP